MLHQQPNRVLEIMKAILGASWLQTHVASAGGNQSGDNEGIGSKIGKALGFGGGSSNNDSAHGAGTGSGNQGGTSYGSGSAGSGNSGSGVNNAGGCSPCHLSRACLLLSQGSGCADQHCSCCIKCLLHSGLLWQARS